MTAERAATTTGRLEALDGLRGLAALVVMVHHIVLASVPLLAAVYLTGADPSLPGWAQALVHTPLHLLWTGEEWVVVFFALSGFVLTMPTVRGHAFSPARYYPHRLLRLYGPVWAALVVAVCLRMLVPHDPVAGASWWLNAHAEPVGGWQLRHDGTLVMGTGGFAATSVLWSLRWEVLFSLFLPLFLWVGRRTRGAPWAAGAAAFAVLAASGTHDAPRYMPAFMLGSLMAFQVDRLRVLGERLAPPTLGNRALKLALVATVVAGMTAGWWLPVGRGAAQALAAAGSCVAVALPIVLRSFGRFLRTPAMQWAGSRSFSLYLVHEPIVVCVALALGGTASVVLVAAVAVPLALLAAELFFRGAERPLHRWSRALGRWSERLVARVAPSLAPGRSRTPV